MLIFVVHKSNINRMVKFFKKYHKWIGLFFSFFLLMFAISGILLNHRKLISKFDIPRKYLPSSYRFTNWNNGAILGTVPLEKNRILMYGSSGVFLTDTALQEVYNFMEGLPQGVDNQLLKSIVISSDSSTLFGISAHHLYKTSKPYNQWQDITENIDFKHDSFNDLYVKDDTLYVVMRSYIYRSKAPYKLFERIKLKEPENYSNQVSLFRTIWVLHSGELFGMIGKLFVDFLGLLIIVLVLTGLIITFWKIPIKRRKKQKKDNRKLKKFWNVSLKWHNKIGYIPFVLLMVLAVTGWFLRPPLLIAIVRAKVNPVPFSILDSPNPWHQKIRNLRYDNTTSEWLLYSSNGFYQFRDFNNTPIRLKEQPPVSVMGINVWKEYNDSTWILGSFSGLYQWNKQSGEVYDMITNKPYVKKRTMGRPTFTNLVSGYSSDFSCGNMVFDYHKGASLIHSDKKPIQMPEFIKEKSRMSLWHFSLELHVGRIYKDLFGAFAPFFIFFSGLFFVFILLSGYVVYRKRHKRKNVKKK